MAGGANPFVLSFDCPEGAVSDDDCTLRRWKLDGLKSGNAVMLTSAGNYVVATDRAESLLRWYPLHPPKFREGEPNTIVSENRPLDRETPVRLLVSLRNSDWVIARDADGRLRRFLAGRYHSDLVAPDHDAMKVVATGERHVVGRIQHGGSDELFLIPIDDTISHVDRGPIRLARTGEVSRVVITPGDDAVAFTVGTGSDAQTNVYRVPNEYQEQADLIDAFSGEMISGRQPLSDLPGMRAVSPDGTHLAFRTPRGSLALRDLESASACVVETTRRNDLRMAGFSAQGVLYFETEHARGESSINAWEPSARRRSSLGEPNGGYRLAQLPARDLGSPWAVAVRDGVYAAVQPGGDVQGLQLDDAVFLPRDDAQLWAVSSRALDIGRDVAVRKLRPSWSDGARKFSNEATEDVAAVRLGSGHVCMSSGEPGAWAYQCGKPNDRTFMSSAPPPASEDDSGRGTDDPEVPTTPSAALCETGTPFTEAASCNYYVDSCCFDSKERACLAQGCDIDLCATRQGDDFKGVICGNQADVEP